jgi:hypothetical protein
MVVAREESEMAHASPSAHLGHWFVFQLWMANIEPSPSAISISNLQHDNAEVSQSRSHRGQRFFTTKSGTQLLGGSPAHDHSTERILSG